MAIIGMDRLLKSGRGGTRRRAVKSLGQSSLGTINAGIEMPWPPSLNTYYRTVHGRILISKEGREYRQLVGRHLLARGIKPLGCKLQVSIDAYPPDRRRRDLDNLLKCLLDSLCVKQGCRVGLYFDDSQIDRLTITRCHPCDGGRVVVTVEVMDG